MVKEGRGFVILLRVPKAPEESLRSFAPPAVVLRMAVIVIEGHLERE